MSGPEPWSTRTAATILGFLEQFVTLAEAMHPGHRVSSLRSDNGPELVSGVFNRLAAEPEAFGASSAPPTHA